MAKVVSDGLKAILKGDYKKAGDSFKAQGKYEKALKMYLRCEDYISASEAESLMGHPDKAVEYLLRAGEVGIAAKFLISRGNYKKAAEILANANMLLEAGKVAEEGKSYQIAVSYYEKTGHFLEAGFCAYKGGMKEKAVILLLKALRDFPLEESIPESESFVWREKKKEIARIFEEGGAYGKAAELYESLGLLEATARCYELSGDLDRALALYNKLGFVEKAQELVGREEKKRLLDEARKLEEEKKYEEAEVIYEKCGSRRDLARVKEILGKYIESAQIYREIGEIEKSAHLFYKGGEFEEAGNALEMIGEYPMAMQAYREGGFYYEASASAVKAEKWEDAVNLILKRREMIEEIIHQFETLPKEKKELPRVKAALARLRVETQNFISASKLLLNVDPDPLFLQEPWVDYLRGRVFEAMGKNRDAVAFYNKVLRKNYAFEDTQQRLHNLISKSPKPFLRYDRIETLCEGIFGKWLKAFDTILSSNVLLHQLKKEAYSNEELREIANAVKKVSHLSHRNILSIKDVISFQDDLYIAYENYEGKPLIMIKDNLTFSLFEAVDLLRQIVEAVYEAHYKGVFPLCLCPETILIENKRRLKMCGLGFPFPTEVSLEERRKFLAYFSPEARRGAPLTPSSDLYSAGALFYLMLFGEEPPLEGFEGFPLRNREKLKSFPGQIETILKKLFSSSQIERYEDAGEVLRDLKSLEFIKGAIISERYEILEEIGKGGMGEVFKVKDLELNEIVALKMLKTKSSMSDISRDAFLREIKITRKIVHPNIIRIYDLGIYNDLIYLTMEFVEGIALNEWVKESFLIDTTLKTRLSILIQIAKGLESAHLLGVIHRDLKPQNIILTKNLTPKILDFGIAYTKEGEELMKGNKFVGSPKYVSPEQIRGKSLDAKSDIYSFGLLAYFVLTGREAITGKSVDEILNNHLSNEPIKFVESSNLPEKLANLILKCVEKDPKNRPPSIKAVARVLEEIE